MVTLRAIPLELKAGGVDILVGRIKDAPALPATDPWNQRQWRRGGT
ncbi:hypothetical protein M1E17_19465 [Arthrobacter sp. D1-29]